MAKYYGKVGYVDNVETSPGVWSPKVTEKTYSGEILRNSRRWQAGTSINDNVVISVEVSFISDKYALDHMHDIRYVTHMGKKWSVSRADYNHPRIVLMLGDVYNEQSN